ncbi:MAG: VWA domain-containing protein, partial [Oscillospiraceae bacterium]|nr:VWA domain-containing protein [Oscillospiraceae bacterium]
PVDLLHRAPGDTVTVNIFRNVSGSAAAYTKTLTWDELSSLTTINVSDYFYAAGISAGWALNTAPAGAAASASVPVSDVLNGTVNFYMNAPTSGWSGREAIVHADNPSLTGQSVVVYTYTALRDAMQSTVYSYIEFGADLTAPTSGTVLISIAANRTNTELVLNAKNYRFDSSRTGDNIIRVASGSTNLTKITYRDWYVSAHRSYYGLLHLTGSRAVTAVFDGLTFTGPQLTYFPSDAAGQNIVLDGSRTPISITQTTPSGADTAQELLEGGAGVTFVGRVDVIRENIGSTSDYLFESVDAFLVREAPADASYPTEVHVTDRRASGRFASVTASFVVEKNASFVYRGNQRFSASGFAPLTVGENAVFDVRTSGALAQSNGLVYVTGALTVGDGAAFVVAAENNGTNTNPALYALGSVTISNPREVLIYNSSTSTNANALAVRLASSVNFSFTGKNITTWAAAPAVTVPVGGAAYGTPTALFENEDQAPYTVTGRASGTSGSFTSVSASGYSGQPAINTTNFTFTGRKVVGSLAFQSYAITYKIVNPDTGEESSAEGAFPAGYPAVQTGKAMLGATVSYYPERVGNYRRMPDQGTDLLIQEGVNEAVVLYRPDAAVAPEAALSKTARRVSADTWEVTLKIGSETGAIPMDVDIMLLLDKSTSLSTTQRNSIADAGRVMVNTLANGENLTGTIRVGVIFFAGTSYTLEHFTRMAPIRTGGVVQTANLNTVLSTLEAYRSGESTNTHMNVPIIMAHYELYHPTETLAGYYTPANPPTAYNPNSAKYMILLSDGEPYPSSYRDPTTAAANDYKSYHDDAKLITIGVGSNSGVAYLNGIQNAGYYAATNDSAIGTAFAQITDNMISTVRSGAVLDPVGAGLLFQATRNGTLPQATASQADVTNYVTVSQGRVLQQLVNGVPTFSWELDGPVLGEATLTYRVKLSNPEGAVNQVSETNGATSLTYNNIYNQNIEASFDVPRVMYQRGSMKIVYEGLPQGNEIDLGVREMYPAAPAPYTFDGPAERIDGRWLTSVTLRGSEGVGSDGE